MILDNILYFCNHRNMSAASRTIARDQVVKYADMFSAMGTEPRLRIMQLLLSAHPEGLVVGEIQSRWSLKIVEVQTDGPLCPKLCPVAAWTH